MSSQNAAQALLVGFCFLAPSASSQTGLYRESGRHGRRPPSETLPCSSATARGTTTPSALIPFAAWNSRSSDGLDSPSAASSSCHLSSGQSSMMSPWVKRTSGPTTSYQGLLTFVSGPSLARDSLGAPLVELLGADV